jgi:Tfp pilus assembly protein PilO
MGTAALTSLRWIVRREASRLRARGISGLALLVVAAGIAFAMLLPAQRRLEQLRSDVGSLRAQLKASGDNASVPPPRATQLETFYAFFPNVESLPDWVGRVHTAAARNDLVLESGDYLLERRKGARLAEYQVTLPVRGSYAQIRGFVAEVLDKVPAAALDDIVIKRENIGAPALEARIRFIVYLSGEPAP